MYKFEHPEYIYLLLLVPFLVVIFVGYRIWQNKAQKKFGALLPHMAVGVNRARPYFKTSLFVLAVGLLSLSLKKQPRLLLRLSRVVLQRLYLTVLAP